MDFINLRKQALHIRFLEETVTTQHVAEGIAIDYTEDEK